MEDKYIHAIYIYLIISSFVSGYRYRETPRRILDSLVAIIGIPLRIPIFTIMAVYYILVEILKEIDRYFCISFIWHIRSKTGYIKHFNEMHSARVARLEFLKSKEVKSWKIRRQIYCIGKVIEKTKHLYRKD